jgi:hypothetical protein
MKVWRRKFAIYEMDYLYFRLRITIISLNF